MIIGSARGNKNIAPLEADEALIHILHAKF